MIKDFFNFLESKRNTECVDCGGKGEAFFVKNDIWYNYIPKSKQRGIICLSCLEKRLGRLNSIGNVGSFLAMATDFDPSAFSSAVQQTLGAVPNPNPSVRFSGPILREAGFTWYFNPKNQEESAKINTIIKKLKAASLPKNTSSGVSGILSYPKLAQINFYPWDSQGANSAVSEANKWGWTKKSIIRLKRCFISQVNINYNPANVPSFFYDNSPVVIEVTISMKEIEYLTSNEWSDW